MALTSKVTQHNGWVHSIDSYHVNGPQSVDLVLGCGETKNVYHIGNLTLLINYKQRDLCIKCFPMGLSTPIRQMRKLP